MPTVFSKIIQGELPAYKVAENEDFLAFLDISPLQKGHTLVIPKIETDYIFNLDKTTFIALQLFSRTVAIALQKAVPCQRIASMVIGLEVPHVHIHLIPIQSEKDMLLSNARFKLSHEEMEAIANDIREAYQDIQSTEK